MTTSREPSAVRPQGLARAGHDPLAAATTHNLTGAGNTSPPVRAKDRIRDAAIELFGEHGFTGVSLKSIADHAGVSAPLVVHHFGSKANLRQECDRHVAQEFRAAKRSAIQTPGMPQGDFFGMMRASRHLIRYLLRAFLVGGPEMDRLFDQLVDDAVEYTDEAERLGLVYPSSHQRNRVALMMMQQFGSLLMAHQMRRQFGFDPTDANPENAGTYVATVMEVYSRPTFNIGAFAELLSAFADAPPTTSEHPPT